MSDEIEEGFALDQGPLAEAVHRLLMLSSAGQWIDVVVPPPGVRAAIEFHVRRLPTVAWSTGERLLWAFCLSVAGQAKVNVKEFADYFAHTELRPQIEAVIRAALKLYDSPETKSPEPFPWMDPTRGAMIDRKNPAKEKP